MCDPNTIVPQSPLIQNRRNCEKEKETDFEIEITRVGYLGSDPDKCKIINLTKLKAEITKEKLWTSRTWRDISETFFDVIKVILLTTVFDHVMDGYQAYQFIHGTHYMKMFPNKLNDSIANSTNCVLTSLHLNANETTDGFQYECTEKAGPK